MRHNRRAPSAPVTIEDAVKRKLVKKINYADRPLNAMNAFNKISNRRTSTAIDAAAIRKMLPDIKLVENLIVDSVLAANDLTNIEPSFYIDDTVFNESPAITEINEMISDHFKKSHKIADKLKRWLRNSLFKYGSQPLIVLPEASIDDIINGDVGTEEFAQARDAYLKKRRDDILNSGSVAIGWLGSGLNLTGRQREQQAVAGLEEYTSYISGRAESANILGYVVSDNTDILKRPDLVQEMKLEAFTKHLHSVGLEHHSPFNGTVGEGSISITNVNPFTRDPETNKQVDALYRRGKADYREVVGVKTQSQLNRPSVGHPTIMEPNADAVIPVHVTGSEGEIIGMFVLLSEDGNPLDLPAEVTRFNSLDKLYADNENGENAEVDASSGIRQAFTKLYGAKSESEIDDMESLRELYQQIVVDDLNTRLVHGVYGKTVELAAHENIFRVMLARKLSNMNTRLLWVPKHLCTYIAFEYNEDGTGRSLTEDTKIVASYRSIVMMATVLGAINSSINHTKINVHLDEDDAEPHKTIYHVVQEYLQTMASMPINTISFQDQYTYLQASSVSVQAEGNSNYMETSVDISKEQRQNDAPNETLNDMLKQMHLSSYGVSVEQLDALLQSDTATAVKAATANFTKSMQNIRNLFNSHVTDFVRIYVSNSQPLRDSIREILGRHKDDMPQELVQIIKENHNDVNLAINDVIRSMMFSLPDADTNISEAQQQSFDAYMNIMQKVAEVHFNENSLSSLAMGENGANMVAQLKESFLSSCARTWLRRNGINEFDDLIYGDASKTTLDKAQVNYVERISDLLRNYVAGVKDIRAQNEKLLSEDAKDVGDFSSSGGSSSFSSSSGSSSSETDNGEMNSDLMGNAEGDDAVDFSF